MNSREIKTQPRENIFLLVILVLGVLVRLLPIWIWGLEGCIRDECTYMRQGYHFFQGEGVVASSGWLWAPGYPVLIAFHKWLFGSFYAIKYTQIACSVAIALLMYRLSSSQKVGCWACALYMFHPAHIFFAQSLWSEVIYGLLLLAIVYVIKEK